MTTEYVRPEATATISVSTPVIAVPAYSETVYDYGFQDYAEVTVPASLQYFQDFASGLGGWTAVSGSLMHFDSAFTPPETMYQYGTNNKATLTLTGLVVGATYTLSATVRKGTGTSARIGITGKGSSTVSTPSSSALYPVSLGFTATGTSHEATLEILASSNGYWESVTLTRNSYIVVTNDGLDGWSSSAGLTVKPGIGESGGTGLEVELIFPTTIARAFTGLTIGHQYTLSGRTKTTASGAWETVAQTFTAASTAQAFSLPSAQVEQVSYWDNMRLVHHVPAVYTNTPALPISQGKVRLDENYSPYVMASFSVPLTSLELLEQIDPRTPQRVAVEALEGVAGVARTYDLGVRSRTVNHRQQTIEIEAASDEILLHDRKNVSTSVDSTPRTYEANLRNLCNWALGKIGATLAPGTDNANLTAAWPVTNLFPDPSAENATLVWTAGSGAPTFTRQSSPVWSGSYSLRINATAAQAYINSPLFSASPGRMYTASFYIRSTVARSARVLLRFSGPNGTLRDTYGTASNTSTSAWGRRSVTAVAPPGTTTMQMYVITDGNASGNFHYIDGVMLNEGILEDWFSGGTANTSQYTYEWTNTANDSSSERIPVVERLPELFNWKPGQSLAEFLQPLLNAAGLRLFCDESRVWRLVNPDTYEVPGYIVAQAKHNAVEGTDTISRNTDEWADAVVVIYTWTDAYGIARERYDVAGDPTGKCITREIERQYPGPGAAQYILNSFTGRGRTQSVTALGQYGATPGQDVSINLPGTLTQTGKARAITFDLNSGLMDIETRGLTDALPGSWALWNPAQTWAQVTPTLLWKDA